MLLAALLHGTRLSAHEVRHGPVVVLQGASHPFYVDPSPSYSSGPGIPVIMPPAPPPPPPAAAVDVREVLAGLDEEGDVFWQLVPPLLLTDPAFFGADLSRVLQLAEIAQGRTDARDADPAWAAVVADPQRPEAELHAYMPGIAPASPWHDPAAFELTAKLEANYDAIKAEFGALLSSERAGKDAFQSVTSMNYDAGWRTLVLYYNGQEVRGFPYDLCPTTKAILDTVPVAGRIVGFNNQQPSSGIPRHTDGNNMWLTLQMGISLPRLPDGDGEGGEGNGDAPGNDGAYAPEGAAIVATESSRRARPYIEVGGEARHWEEGKCMVYDTTYEHETFNPSECEERVVLHVDFWNAVSTRVPEARPAAAAAGALSDAELAAMRRVYSLREKFLQSEGVASVAEQRLGR